VLRALRKAGVHVVALHNHMVGEQPRSTSRTSGARAGRTTWRRAEDALDAQKATGAGKH